MIDADLNTEGKFTSGIGFDSIDPDNAKIDLDYNELSFTQANWSISTWFQYPINNPFGDEYALTWADGASYPAFLFGSCQIEMQGNLPHLPRSVHIHLQMDCLLDTGTMWKYSSLPE